MAEDYEAARAALRFTHQTTRSGIEIIRSLHTEIELALASGTTRQQVYNRLVEHASYPGSFVSFQSTLQRVRGVAGSPRRQEKTESDQARMTWALTTEGRLAYDLAQQGHLERLCRGNAPGWRREEREDGWWVFPFVYEDENTGKRTIYGWRIPPPSELPDK